MNYRYYWALILLITITGCSSTGSYRKSVGSYDVNQEAAELYKTYQSQPDYNYYYAGSSMNYPEAIVGIHNEYRIEETAGYNGTAIQWREFDPNDQNLEKLVKGIDKIGRPYGATLFCPARKQVGVLYTNEVWEYKPLVRLLQDNVVYVSPKVYTGNNQGAP
jgi:hypothetical protein